MMVIPDLGRLRHSEAHLQWGLHRGVDIVWVNVQKVPMGWRF